jgi:hypothetical protein
MSEEGIWAKLTRLFWGQPSVSRPREKLDIDIVDPFERIEMSIRRASEGSEDKN